SPALWVDGSRYVGLPNLQRLLRQDDRRGRTTAGSTESADRRTGGASEDGSREDARAGRSRESEGRSAGEQDHRRWTEGQRGISAVPVDHGRGEQSEGKHRHLRADGGPNPSARSG